MALALVAAAAAVLVLPLLGWRKSLFAAVLGTVTVVPITIVAFGSGEDPYIQGIAPQYVTISAASASITLALLWVVTARRGPMGESKPLTLAAVVPLAPIVLILTWGQLFVWPQVAPVVSGVLHITLACGAWLVGIGFVRFLDTTADEALAFARFAVGLALVLAVPSWLQWAQGAGVEGYGARAGGLFAHPATAGKVAIVLVCILLPLLDSPNPRISRTANLAVVLAAAATFPSLSRANIAGLAIVLLGWVVLNARRRGAARRLAGLGLVGIAFIPFMGQLLQRFVSDPSGSDRPVLTMAAYRWLPEYWVVGIGPNNFVAELMGRDAVIGELGQPVHNIFLLALAEMGVVGLAAFLPLLGVVLWGVRKGWDGARSAQYSKALLLLIVAVAFVGWTGWGMLRAPMAQFVAFAAGLLWANAVHGNLGGSTVRGSRPESPIRSIPLEDSAQPKRP